MKATILAGIVIALAAVALVTLPADLGFDQAQPDSVSAGSSLPGDVNCDGTVNSIDAALVLQFSAGLLGVLPCPENGDVNGDGNINALDAALILQFAAGLLGTLGTPPTPTNTPTNTATNTPTTAPNCDPAYPDFCIPPPPPDLNCADINGNNFTVLPPDPHGWDGNNDGVGCQS